MKEEINIEEVTSSVEIYQQQERAVIDGQIATAKQYPRNIKRSVENAIATVTLDKETAQTCNYSLPRGGKTISGPSVHLAKVLAQTWGNMRVEAKVVAVDQHSLTSQSVAFDLENNLAIKVEVKRSIMTKKGRMNEDMITVTGNAANAIALRNAVLSVVPKMVVDKVYKAAITCITGDLSDETKFIKKRTLVFTGFKDTYGVEEPEVLAVLGKSSIGQITQEDIVTLIGLAQALKDGDTTVEETFRKQNPKINKELLRFTEMLEKCTSDDDIDMLVTSFDEELPEDIKKKVEEKRKSFK